MVFPLTISALILLGLFADQVGAEPTAPVMPPAPPPSPPPFVPGMPAVITPVAPSAAAPSPTVATNPREVMNAFIDQLAEQSNVRGAKPMASLARRTLTVHEPSFSALVIPCDQRLHRLLPAPELLERIASTMGDSYQVGQINYPARWSHPEFGSVAICAIVFHHPGAPTPTRDQVLGPVAESLRKLVGRGEFIEYGAIDQYGILDVILNSVVASAVGTVTSMGVQDLVHSAGGERRLARIVRRYKRAEQREGPRARKLLGKIKRTAERLKGRKVDWAEIDTLIAQYDAQQDQVS